MSFGAELQTREPMQLGLWSRAGLYDQGYGELETGWRSPVAKRSKRNG